MAAAYAKTAAPEGLGVPRTNLCEKFNVSGNRPFFRLTALRLGCLDDSQNRCHTLHLPLEGQDYRIWLAACSGYLPPCGGGRIARAAREPGGGSRSAESNKHPSPHP